MLAAPKSADPANPRHSNSGDSRWLLAERVAASPAFERSPRLAQLLLYLCQHHIAGSDDRLSEQTIAAEVFGRGRDFDSASDTIVRSHMLRLRQKLETHFREEGVQEEQQITIPRGRYVPNFHAAQIPVDATEDASAVGRGDVVPQTAQFEGSGAEAVSRHLRPRYWIAIVVVIVLLLCLSGVAAWKLASPVIRLQGAATSQLWRQLFPKRSTTLLVAADSGLVLLHGITGENTTLGEYTGHDLRRSAQAAVGMTPETAMSLAGRRYTSFVDLELFDRITHLPEALAGSYSIRYARDLSINELKSANVIFSGSEDADPWIETYESSMNFALEDNLRMNERGFSNRNPKPGEPARFIAGKTEYGVLAFLANPSGSGSALIIEGTSVAGTESASDFLFNTHELEPFLESIRRPDGSLPHFEVIISAQSLNGSAAPSKTLAWRVHER